MPHALVAAMSGSIPQNVHHAREIVREDAERHLGADLFWQALHQKVRRTHPHLQCSEWITRLSLGVGASPAENILGLHGHVCKLCPIRTAMRHLLSDDEMVLGFHCHLHVIARDAGATPARRH